MDKKEKESPSGRASGSSGGGGSKEGKAGKAEKEAKATKKEGSGSEESSQRSSASAGSPARVSESAELEGDPFWPPPFAPIDLPALIKAEQARNPAFNVYDTAYSASAAPPTPTATTSPAKGPAVPDLGKLQPWEASLAAVKADDDTRNDAQAIPALDSPLWQLPPYNRTI